MKNRTLGRILSGIGITLVMISCGKRKADVNEQSIHYDYELTSKEKIKSFELDNDTYYNAFYLYRFTDDLGQEYVSFLNYRTNQILFYDFSSCQLLFKTELPSEGPHGVNRISGYYIKDWNNIYVSSYGIPGLIRIDTAGLIRQKIPYGKTNEGYEIIPSYEPSSRPYIPPIFIGNKVYITQKPVDRLYSATHTPVSVVIDTLNKTCAQCPFFYGDILEKDHLSKSGDTRFSRDYDGEHFIYSFYTDEYIYVTSIDHQQVRKIKVKSKYIDRIKNETTPDNSDANLMVKNTLERAQYGDLIYDKYRNVYYRFAYPQTELDFDNYLQRTFFGRKRFSVIILDKEFNIIGETLFPESIYNSYVFFVHSDGLYISKDYQINYDQSDDSLNFQLFELSTSSK